MFDDLRRQSLGVTDEPPTAAADEDSDTSPSSPAKPTTPGQRPLGLLPWQWAVLAVLLFLGLSLMACGTLIMFGIVDITRWLPF